MLDHYRDQAQLLVDVLPYVAQQDVFALKGGTAINLFHRDLPRLSVDIDLTYRGAQRHRRAAAARPGLGIKLLYEIHVGTVAMSAGRAHALLDGLDPDAIGAIFDLPNMSRVALEDTRQSLELLGPHLAYCHIGGSRPVAGEADEHGQRQWSWEFCAMEEGVADIPQVVADLRAVGYDGYLTIEDFSTRDTDLKLSKGTAYLRRLLEIT